MSREDIGASRDTSLRLGGFSDFLASQRPCTRRATPADQHGGLLVNAMRRSRNPQRARIFPDDRSASVAMRTGSLLPHVLDA